MAARLNRRHSELVLKRIKTSQLVNRLQDNALGTLAREMSKGQIQSAIALIDRTLAKAQHPIEVDARGEINVRVTFVDP